MSIHLNAQQTTDWHIACEAVEQTAANTDHESSSKSHIDTMAQYVRDEPTAILRLLATV